MANPLIGMMGGAPAANPAMWAQNNLMQAAQSAKRMMGILQAVKDPKQALMMAAQKNPQLNAVMQMVGNGNPKDIFYQKCKEMGVNPEDILRQLR